MIKYILIAVLLLFAAPVSAAYEPPSNDIIVFADESGGLRAPISEHAKVPVFCLYKSGRLIFSQTDSSGFIYLMDTTLSESQIEEVKKLFDSSEEWNDAYEDCPIKDMPAFNITFNIDGNPRKIYIRGVDYAIKNKTIPQKLTELYRFLSFYSNEDAKEYKEETIFLYAKQVDDPRNNKNSKIFRWRSRIELSSITSEPSLLGISAMKLSGKQAKGVLGNLEMKTPYKTAQLPVFFKQGNNFYSLGYRPLLPHEL